MLILVGNRRFQKGVQQTNQMQPVFEFHISRAARDRYQFDDSIFSISGNVVFANFHAARVFADKMNRARDLVNFPEQSVRAGQINAMGLIDEILHLVVALYRETVSPDALLQADNWLRKRIEADRVDLTYEGFVEDFPPTAVYRREQESESYLAGAIAGVSNRLVVLEELLLLWLANINPAFAPFLELFDDDRLEQLSAYPEMMESLHEFFEIQPKFGPENQNLIDLLRSPARAHPHSLTGQLEYIREKWGYLLGRHFYRILSSLDLIQEEYKAIFFGAGPATVYDFTGLDLEPERFSPDLNWMPRVVLIAKNAKVWLDQLSKKYEQHIYRLDQIPDEELDMLRNWGITGLWLIGLWERSRASRQIKQQMGNPEAAASAYAIFEYEISSDLGGDSAYQNLRDRAWARGIRLASDMVPNHMGIDSKWVMANPQWFISLDYSPFPAYSFTGPDYSPDSGVGIYIEDHYFEKSDAAVVFKRVERSSGETRYIYHGNDGTNMPWNDTAQLNFLSPQVREAVIQTILHVARKFSIIRFDAAMTLAKKHYQRLWYPDPGTGGAIPSRAEHGMSRAEFDRLMPLEFWREVVDRVAQEVPETLLLAEAFWLMEGYFVRTLGMHRVYNSAFMNMLRDEENANYRSVMKNTLEFDPEILKRFVNFMNNPDERTAVDQFGKGDKYFGVCAMMATLPGLPMFGHGQVEGFAEKYGMEFVRANWQEQPDYGLVQRHEREIFPLLHRRDLFADAKNFLLYDFFTRDGHVNEDVFAYSNRSGDERALVIYHNKYASTSGWIRTSVAYADRTGSDGDRRLIQRTLAAGLGLRNEPHTYSIFRDQLTGLEYIRSNKQLYEQGFYQELQAYECHVYLDFREVTDDDWHRYSYLTEYLDGRGVPNVEDAAQEILLRPIHEPFRELIHPGFIGWLREVYTQTDVGSDHHEAAEQIRPKAERLLGGIRAVRSGDGEVTKISDEIVGKMKALLSLPQLETRFPKPRSRKYKTAVRYLDIDSVSDPPNWATLLSWMMVHNLGKVASEAEHAGFSRSWIDEWQLGKLLILALQDLGIPGSTAREAVTWAKVLTSHQGLYQMDFDARLMPYQVAEHWLQDVDVQMALRVNRYQDVLWFGQEPFEHFVWLQFVVAVIQITAQAESDAGETAERILACYRLISDLRAAAQRSGYQVQRFLELVHPEQRELTKAED